MIDSFGFDFRQTGRRRILDYRRSLLDLGN
jgi:hypothetical protein